MLHFNLPFGHFLIHFYDKAFSVQAQRRAL
jgi:hypothetical protein